MNPTDYLQAIKDEIFFVLTKKNDYSEAEAESIFETIEYCIERLLLIRVSKKLTIQFLSKMDKEETYTIGSWNLYIKFKSLDFIQSNIVQDYILKLIRYDDSFVYAFNWLIQQENKDTGIPSPLKEISEDELFNLLKD